MPHPLLRPFDLELRIRTDTGGGRLDPDVTGPGLLVEWRKPGARYWRRRFVPRGMDAGLGEELRFVSSLIGELERWARR